MRILKFSWEYWQVKKEVFETMMEGRRREAASLYWWDSQVLVALAIGPDKIAVH
jgi:hypothetical protein